MTIIISVIIRSRIIVIRIIFVIMRIISINSSRLSVRIIIIR